MSEYPQVPVTDESEWLAVWNGEIRGDYYASDDETWACESDLGYWRATHWPECQ